jgi:hypothetical protein
MPPMDMELLNSKLETVDAKFDTIHEILIRIEAQTTKTNGRVTALETKVTTMSEASIQHVLNCPVKKDVENMQDDLEEYRMFKKYPKIALGIVLVSCLFLFIATYLSWTQFTRNIQKDIKQIEQVK